MGKKKMVSEGERFRLRRTALGLKPGEVAQAIGVTRRTIYNLERDTRSVIHGTVCDYVGVLEAAEQAREAAQ
jgi:DNA-binding XRE family transcriptional regulator